MDDSAFCSCRIIHKRIHDDRERLQFGPVRKTAAQIKRQRNETSSAAGVFRNHRTESATGKDIGVSRIQHRKFPPLQQIQLKKIIQRCQSALEQNAGGRLALRRNVDFRESSAGSFRQRRIKTARSIRFRKRGNRAAGTQKLQKFIDYFRLERTSRRKGNQRILFQIIRSESPEGGIGEFDSVGVLIEGYDNTFTNMRIANVRTGVKILSQGNSLRNIHPLFTGDFAFFPDSCGFYDTGGNNFYSFCYSDQFSTGFFTGKNALPGKYTDCFCLWYTSQSAPHIAFNAEKNFDALVSGFTVAFRPDAKDNYILKTGSDGGKGAFCNLIASFGHCHDDEYKKYLAGKSIPF